MPPMENLSDILTSGTKPSLLDGPSLKEPMETVLVEEVDSDDCPDGGLRAWLVVLGVRSGRIFGQCLY